MVKVIEKNNIVYLPGVHDAAKYLLEHNYKYVKKISELPKRIQRYFREGLLPTIRTTKRGYIQVVVPDDYEIKK